MTYEVHITKHWSGKTFNVDLVSFDRRGSGIAHGKAFNVSEKEALKEAQRMCDLYSATLIAEHQEA
jgi:hypothetical protein